MLFSAKDKKGISIMIGYVLLITFAIVIGTIVFQWMKTYVPRDAPECSEGVSIFLQDYKYDCVNNVLDISLVNNGRFSLGGYFIYATNSTEQTLASRDLSSFSSLALAGNLILFGNSGNDFEPDSSISSNTFNLAISDIGRIYSIEIVPARWQVENRRNILVSCTDAKVREVVQCA